MENERYSCFICWESFSLSNEEDKNRIISCCHCSHHDYKYVHKDCIKYWVKNSKGSNKKCNICCTPYIIQKSTVPFSSLLKDFWILISLYLLFLVSTFILTVIFWAKYMIPTAVYIVSPKFNEETKKYENEKDMSVIYVKSDIYRIIFTILQTSLLLLLSIYVGKILLVYIDKKTTTKKLIGINPDNQIIFVELFDKEDEEMPENRSHKFLNSFLPFLYIKPDTNEDSNALV